MQDGSAVGPAHRKEVERPFWGRQLNMVPRWIVLSAAALLVAFTALSELRQAAFHSPALVDDVLTWQIVFAAIVIVWGAAVLVSTIRRLKRPRT